MNTAQSITIEEVVNKSAVPPWVQLQQTGTLLYLTLAVNQAIEELALKFLNSSIKTEHARQTQDNDWWVQVE